MLAAANEAVDIRAFRRIMPSMDQIFISAVESYNSSNPAKQ